jgi:hypothetical protein
MQYLKTASTKLTGNSARVDWKISDNKCGTINVTLPVPSESIDVIAELCAIRYLVFDKVVFGQKIYTGKGLSLDVSKGAIKKLVSGKSSKKDAERFAKFIPMMLSGCELQVHKNKSILDGCIEVFEENLNIDLDYYGLAQIDVETPAMGSVTITAHSIERYRDRVIAESGECLHPLSSLVKRLNNPENEQQPVPKSVLEHKERKYGTQDEFEVWKHPTSTLNFGIIRNKTTSKRTLVTTYIRNTK